MTYKVLKWTCLVHDTVWHGEALVTFYCAAGDPRLDVCAAASLSFSHALHCITATTLLRLHCFENVNATFTERHEFLWTSFFR